MDAKEKKKRFGVTMAPTPCTEAWRRSMAFDHNSKGIVTWSYIVVNRYLGTRTHINLYNGDTGPGYNATKNTHKIKKWDEWQQAVHAKKVQFSLDGTALVALDAKITQLAKDAEKALAKSLQLGGDNPYSRCLISECPAAVLADPPVGWVGDPILEPEIPVVPEIPEVEVSEGPPVASV